jgi:hypothetical protein
MTTLTPPQGRERIMKLQVNYLKQIDSLRREYREEIKKITEAINVRKVEAVRAKLKVKAK